MKHRVQLKHATADFLVVIVVTKGWMEIPYELPGGSGDGSRSPVRRQSHAKIGDFGKS